MILHTVSAAAVFVDQVAQAPVVVQCMQSAQESWVKWLLPTIAQTVVSLASIIAGVGIAVWSFRRNRKSENEQWARNQKAGHGQWIRDQKKSDWRELLRQSAGIQRIFRIVNTPNRERIEKIAEQLKPAVHELSVTAASCVFLRDFFADQANHGKFHSFIRDADEASELIDALRSIHRSPDFPPTQQESIDLISKILVKSQEVTQKYFAFNEWLIKEAADDLGISQFETSAM